MSCSGVSPTSPPRASPTRRRSPRWPTARMHLARSFQADEASFARSDGADWVRGMQRDLSQLATLRAAGIETGNTLREAHGEVRRGPRPASRFRARDRVRVPRRFSSARPRAAPPRDVPALPPAMASPVVDAVTTTTTTTTTVPDHHRRMMVAWITAAVLLVWLAISVWTVRSILDPGGPPDRGDPQARARRRCARAARRAEGVERPVHRFQPHGVSAARGARDHARLPAHARDPGRAAHPPASALGGARPAHAACEPAPVLHPAQSLDRAGERGAAAASPCSSSTSTTSRISTTAWATPSATACSSASRSASRRRRKSCGFAARLGGDEFTIVHEQVDSAQDGALGRTSHRRAPSSGRSASRGAASP